VPVRGTTHARIMKRVINRDEGGDGRVTSSGTHYVMCAYGPCDNDGFENNKVRENMAAPGHPPRYYNYVFCSERHKQLWLDELYRNRQ
jgi:hypothetical protein